MQAEIEIKESTDSTGRKAYTVANTLMVYNKEEADALTQTGIHKLQCPMTRGLLFAFRRQESMSLDRTPYPAPNGRGSLAKFPWE